MKCPSCGFRLNGWPKKSSERHGRSLTTTQVIVIALRVAAKVSKNTEMKPLYQELIDHLEPVEADVNPDGASQ